MRGNDEIGGELVDFKVRGNDELGGELVDFKVRGNDEIGGELVDFKVRGHIFEVQLAALLGEFLQRLDIFCSGF